MRIFLHYSSVPYSAAVFATVSLVSPGDALEAQANWVNAIKQTSQVYFAVGDYVGLAAQAAGELYGYGQLKVLFKDAGFVINGGSGMHILVTTLTGNTTTLDVCSRGCGVLYPTPRVRDRSKASWSSGVVCDDSDSGCGESCDDVPLVGQSSDHRFAGGGGCQKSCGHDVTAGPLAGTSDGLNLAWGGGAYERNPPR